MPEPPSRTTRFVIRTTDVLQDMRVNVYEEGSPDRVVWYKERFLGDNEIIEQVVHNHTSRVFWTIHRPFRGWYIRLRAPTFPPGVFIPLTPVPQGSPYHVDASLSLSSRTNPTPTPDNKQDITQRSLTLQDDSSQAGTHSYPPTPPPTQLSVPSVPIKDKGGPDSQSQVTQFILAPSNVLPIHQGSSSQQSFLSRALSVLKSHSPAHSNSFTLSRVPLNTPLSPPPPYALNLPAADVSRSTVALTTSAPVPPGSAQGAVPLHAPLLTFHDRTPVLTVRSLTGLLEIDTSEECLLGVDTSFWIAVALTYLEFLEEREVGPQNMTFLIYGC
ncbi:hypothetical protein P691DRAFT_809036 [Macrolepiota fuliginosa MF-IS2]|uniref:Uncharacterized protein n=1 Tax=Macrolepiota fuliginosa MF-IS2 TaxID=1400762 RepID=A0A9P5XK35_9AGAR|nr:hypothetical protein P691DRAFT_809036 [Macrolepiota fuliginosa MF-IS2]